MQFFFVAHPPLLKPELFSASFLLVHKVRVSLSLYQHKLGRHAAEEQEASGRRVVVDASKVGSECGALPHAEPPASSWCILGIRVCLFLNPGQSPGRGWGRGWGGGLDGQDIEESRYAS